MREHSRPSFFAIIAAAGKSLRMGSALPKQYLPLKQRVVIDYVLETFLAIGVFKKIVVVISKEDKHWHTLSWSNHPLITTVQGGNIRAQSVLNGLHSLVSDASSQDWVVVHDAARPCLQVTDLQALMDILYAHPVGGLLGSRIHDTLKHCDEAASVQKTVDRRTLWRAQTPQMFRYGLLQTSLEKALSDQQEITDEAQAIERLGKSPQVIPGCATNIKITQPEDLRFAEFLLA